MQAAFARTLSPISWSKILPRHSEESGVHGCVVAGRADAPLGQPVAVYVQPSAGVNGKELIERLQRRCCVAT
jgi:hypothetical protein